MENAVIIHKQKPYLFTQNSIQTIEPSAASKYRVGARLPLRYITALTFKLPLNLSKEQLAVQVELKMYNEGGLDPNQDYAIDFVSYPIEEENIYLVEAFAAAREDIENEFAQIAKKIGFIDIVYPKFITYEALYDRELAVSENHLFLSIEEDEAFAAVYQKGQYIGYRSIDSLSQLSKKLGIEITRLKSILSQKGVDAQNYTPEEMHLFDTLQEAIFKNVEKIVYAVNFKRSYFGLDHIDRLIVDFGGELIPGLRNMFLSFGVEGEWIEQPLSCCSFKAKEASLAVEAAYVAHYDEMPHRLNFTFFERKKPLWRYRVVQLAAALLLLVAGIGALWAYIYKQSGELSHQIAQKERRLASLKKNNARLFEKLKNLKAQKAELQKQIAQLEERIAIYQDTLDAIPFVEKNKIAREKMMNDIVEALYRFRLSTKSIEQNGTKFANVDILSQNEQREKIARFIRYLLQKSYKNVQTKKIERIDDLYESRVKVAK